MRFSSLTVLALATAVQCSSAFVSQGNGCSRADISLGLGSYLDNLEGTASASTTKRDSFSPFAATKTVSKPSNSLPYSSPSTPPSNAADSKKKESNPYPIYQTESAYAVAPGEPIPYDQPAGKSKLEVPKSWGKALKKSWKKVLKRDPEPLSGMAQQPAEVKLPEPIEQVVEEPVIEEPELEPIVIQSDLEAEYYSYGDINTEEKLAQSTFAIDPEVLIAHAKHTVFVKGLGLHDDARCLAEDFVFRGAQIETPRSEFVKALGSFNLGEFFEIKQQYYGWFVDPLQPNRVWFMNRQEATHTQDFYGAKASGKLLKFPPESLHLDFNENGEVTEFGFYTVDRAYGNTGGLGGAYGFFYGVGKPLPFPEARPYKMSTRRFIYEGVGKTVHTVKTSKAVTTAIETGEKTVHNIQTNYDQWQRKREEDALKRIENQIQQLQGRMQEIEAKKRERGH